MKTGLGMLSMNPSVMNQALSSGKVVAHLALRKQRCVYSWYVLGYTWTFKH